MFSVGRVTPKEARGGQAADLDPLPSGLATLDAILPGGFLRGQIAELSGPPSCGKRALALALCARALEAGLSAAWVDAQGGFFPLPALEAGLPIDRLLVVRVAGAKAAGTAASLILRSPGAVTVLVLDVEGPFTLPDASFARLRHLAEEGGCAVLFVTERDPSGPALSTFVSLRLRIERSEPLPPTPSPFRGGGFQAAFSTEPRIEKAPSPHRGEGVGGRGAMEIIVLKNKFGPVRQSASVIFDGPDRLRVDSSL
jgi:hypothetical protein